MFRRNLFGSAAAALFTFCLLLIGSGDSAKSYVCNSKEKIEQIKSLNTTLKRLIHHEDRLYFVFQDRTISTKLAAAEEKGHFKFLSLDFEEVEIEDDPPHSIPSEQRVFGYSHVPYEPESGGRDALKEPGSPEVHELYYLDLNQNRSDKPQVNPIYDKYYVLSFQDGQVKRSELKQIKPADEHQFKNYDNMGNNVIYLEKHEINQKIVEVTYSWDSSEDAIDYTLHFNVYGLMTQNRSSVMRYQPAFSMFAYHLFKMEHDDNRDGAYHGGNETKYGQFIGVQQKVAALQFFIIFVADKHSSKIYEFQLQAEELFNCYAPVEHMDKHLAGVYHDETRKLWYVFVRRFYLKIDRDLLGDEFAIDPVDYLYYGRELKPFRSEPFVELSKFGRMFKLVKSVKGDGYFSPIQRFAYNHIDVDEAGELMFTPLSSDSKLDLSVCAESTLLIQNRLFCWKEADYIYLYDMNNPDASTYLSYPINELFAGTDLDWSGQQVKLVFHYDKERFVVMTGTNVFVFKYARFGVADDNRLVYLYNETEPDELIKKRNCLLSENCASYPPNYNKRSLHSLILKVSIGVLVFFVLAALLLLIWTFRRGPGGERSERAQYLLRVVSKISSKLSIGSRVEASSQVGSLSDLPAEHVKPKKADIVAKVARSLKRIKKVKDLKSQASKGSSTSQLSLDSQASGLATSRTSEIKSKSKSKTSDKGLKSKSDKSPKSDKSLKDKSGKDSKSQSDKDSKSKSGKSLKSKSDKSIKSGKSDKSLKGKKPNEKELKSKKSPKK